jgi:hypothetical protein
MKNIVKTTIFGETGLIIMFLDLRVKMTANINLRDKFGVICLYSCKFQSAQGLFVETHICSEVSRMEYRANHLSSTYLAGQNRAKGCEQRIHCDPIANMLSVLFGAQLKWIKPTK